MLLTHGHTLSCLTHSLTHSHNNTVTHLCTVDPRTHEVQPCRFLEVALLVGWTAGVLLTFSFLRLCLPAFPRMARTSLPASTSSSSLGYGVFTDKVFLRVTNRKSALEAAELLDPGLLRSYPRSSWEALETPERVGATRQSSPISSSISPNVSSSFSSTVPPCLAGVGGRLETGSVLGSDVVGAVVRPLSPPLVPVVSPVGQHMSVPPPVAESSTAVSGARSGPASSDIEQSTVGQEVASQVGDLASSSSGHHEFLACILLCIFFVYIPGQDSSATSEKSCRLGKADALSFASWSQVATLFPLRLVLRPISLPFPLHRHPKVSPERKARARATTNSSGTRPSKYSLSNSIWTCPRRLARSLHSFLLVPKVFVLHSKRRNATTPIAAALIFVLAAVKLFRTTIVNVFEPELCMVL